MDAEPQADSASKSAQSLLAGGAHSAWFGAVSLLPPGLLGTVAMQVPGHPSPTWPTGSSVDAQAGDRSIKGTGVSGSISPGIYTMQAR